MEQRDKHIESGKWAALSTWAEPEWSAAETIDARSTAAILNFVCSKLLAGDEINMYEAEGLCSDSLNQKALRQALTVGRQAEVDGEDEMEDVCIQAEAAILAYVDGYSALLEMRPALDFVS